MGSYGIGVSRAVAAIIEQNHDEKGIVWPATVSPLDIHIVAAGKDEEIFVKALEISQMLEKENIDVLYDDRKQVSPGVKFNDAELLGMPLILVVGKKLSEGLVELRIRKSGEVKDIKLQDINNEIKKHLK